MFAVLRKIVQLKCFVWILSWKRFSLVYREEVFKFVVCCGVRREWSVSLRPATRVLVLALFGVQVVRKLMCLA